MSQSTFDFAAPSKDDAAATSKKRVRKAQDCEQMAQALEATNDYRVLRRLLPKCRIPDDCIDPRRYPLLAAREAMRQLVDDLLGRSILASGAHS
jgi:hypothetical protein